MVQGNVQVAGLIEKTVEGLGYAFVEAAWAGAGLLRVTIDRRDGEPVTVDDCEQVTRQLQYLLEVEGVDYNRLEVSSPGLDRLLRGADDFARYAGQAVDVTLRMPFQGRKKYRGILQPSTAEGQYAIRWDAALLAELAEGRPGLKRPARAAKAAAARSPAAAKGAALAAAAGDVAQELNFSMAEVREVRLVPVLDFKGRKKS